MQTPYVIFFRAIGLYLLFTLPTLAEPVMYFFSAFLATIYGLSAGALFIIFYLVISLGTFSFEIKRSLLFIAVLAGVTFSYLLMGYFDAVDDLWGFNGFLIFPIIAVIAGWVSLLVSRKAIKEHFSADTNNIENF